MATTTLILGGGFGGLATANELRRLLPREHRVIVVDRKPTFYVGAVKTWIALGSADPKTAGRDRKRLEARGIEFVHADIRSIDPKEKLVRTDRGDLTGDHLIVALGAELDMNLIPGLARGAQHFYEVEAASRLRRELNAFRGGELVVLIPKSPFTCPPAPYEAAIVFADHMKKRGISAKVSLITVEGSPMATAGPQIGVTMRELMTKAGVEYKFQTRTQSVDPARKVIQLEGGAEVPYTLLVAIPPHVAPAVLKDTGLLGPSGWIPIDNRGRVANHPGVYAVGDVSVMPLPGRFKPDAGLVLPKAGTAAELLGTTIGQNIALEVLGRSARATYSGDAFCFIETGDMHAVKGEANFFELPHPTMTSGVPDMTQYDQKHQWVRDVMDRLVG